MSLPIQKRDNKIIISFSKELYTSKSVDKAIDEYSSIAKRLKSQESRRYQKIELKVSQLKEALEWANYLFYLNR